MPSATPSKTDVYGVLMQKCAFEVLDEQEKPNQLRIMGRSQRDRWPFFLPVIRRLLMTSKKPGSPWTCDISKMYIEQNEKVFYTWRLIFQGTDLRTQYANIISTIRSAEQPARVELDRQLLPGYKEGDVRGGVNAKGKGASSAGTMPMAVTRSR